MSRGQFLNSGHTRAQDMRVDLRMTTPDRDTREWVVKYTYEGANGTEFRPPKTAKYKSAEDAAIAICRGQTTIRLFDPATVVVDTARNSKRFAELWHGKRRIVGDKLRAYMQDAVNEVVKRNAGTKHRLAKLDKELAAIGRSDEEGDS
jgi:hypothetical protein